MLKIATKKKKKKNLILHLVGSFGLSRIFLAWVPHPTSSPTGTENFESPPPIKKLEKKNLYPKVLSTEAFKWLSNQQASTKLTLRRISCSY